MILHGWMNWAKQGEETPHGRFHFLPTGERNGKSDFRASEGEDQNRSAAAELNALRRPARKVADLTEVEHEPGDRGDREGYRSLSISN